MTLFSSSYSGGISSTRMCASSKPLQSGNLPAHGSWSGGRGCPSQRSSGWAFMAWSTHKMDRFRTGPAGSGPPPATFRQVTEQSCHGPTHQLAGQGSSLQTRVSRSCRLLWAFCSHSAFATMPSPRWWQTDSRCCFPPPHVAEQRLQSASFQ